MHPIGEKTFLILVVLVKSQSQRLLQKKSNYSVHLQHREIIVDTANVVTKLCAQ